MNVYYWTAAVVMLFAAGMLVAAIGEAGLWIAVIAVGIVATVIGTRFPRTHG
jgi:hypothetical protein